MALAIVLAVAGLVLLTFAADHLVIGSSRLASRMRISPVVVGVVVIGLGTSAPEFLVSGIAAARGDAGIAIGNVVGSNILNLTLILGIAAVIGTVKVSAVVIRREIRLAVVAVAAFGLAIWVGLTAVAGAVLGVAAVIAVWQLLRWAQHDRDERLAEEAKEFTGLPDIPSNSDSPPAGPIWSAPVRAVLGLIGVLVGAQLLVANAAAIAERLGVSQIVIGFTLVALGTSVPELVTAIAAQRRGESDLVVGNLFGSNLFNSLAGGAVVGLASGTAAPQRPAAILLLAMVLVAVAAWVLLRRGLAISRLEGAVLLVIYLATVPVLFAT